MGAAANINRSNNFDFLRLLFASLVIVSHSYPLTGQPEILGVLTNEQLSLGSLSVDSFFIMSGYLITMSLQRSTSPQEYMWKRLLRLYPAYIVLLILTMLFLPVIYEGKNILHEKSFWSYFPNCLSLYKVQYQVNGIFTNNPYPHAINGSLWSLSYEFTMYIALLLLFPLRKSKYLSFIITSVFIIALYCSTTNTELLRNKLQKIFLAPNEFYKLCAYFMAGGLCAFINLRKLNFLWLKSLLFLILIGSLYLEIYKYIGAIFLPLLILLIGISSTPYINNIGKKIGDISYGVYIYGFIVQQTLMYYLGLTALPLMLLSLIITYILAYGSWHLIEKKMLTYKNIIK